MTTRHCLAFCIVALSVARCGSKPGDGATSFATPPPLLHVNASLVAPTMLHPGDWEDVSTRPAYQWQETSGATSYWLFVVDHEGGIFSQDGYPAESFCSGGTCSVTPDFELIPGSSRWFVLASNADGDGPWSDGIYFNATTAVAPPVPASPPGESTAGHCHNDIADASETGVDCGADCLPCRGDAFASGIYPQGERFGLILLAAEVSNPAAMQEAKAAGWNVGDAYSNSYWAGDEIAVDHPFIQTNASEGFLAWVGLGAQNYFAGCASSGGCYPYSESTMRSVIADRAIESNVAWWSLPEEQRYWYAGEMDVVNSYSSWTRAYDPAQRPNIMYIPGHYGSDAVAHYVPALDVVPASLYSQYKGQPYAWTRWQMEATIQGIQLAGASLGRDYLHGEKTPAAYLELYDYDSSWATWTNRQITPEGSVHDFWQAIVSGARALIIYAHDYRTSSPALAASWTAFCNAARSLTGPENLEGALLYGAPAPSVSVQVTGGPARTPAFIPDGYDTATDYPSADSLAVRYDGEVFVIVVSSSEDANIQIAVNGLPSLGQADVLFEERTLALTNGRLVDDVAPLGVHVYRVIETP